MNDALADYYAALERLKKRKAKINNDTVAIEAGRKKGSIKKSRPRFDNLIAAIDLASRGASQSTSTKTEPMNRDMTTEKTLQSQLDAALARELSLLVEVFELRNELVQLRGGNIIPIREHASITETSIDPN
jgi:hypothetical protein